MAGTPSCVHPTPGGVLKRTYEPMVSVAPDGLLTRNLASWHAGWPPIHFVITLK